VPTGISKYPVDVLDWSDTLAGVADTVAQDELVPSVVRYLPELLV
jgi:hypothetical protein